MGTTSRKKLQKVVLRRQHKQNRAKLLAELKQCQLQPNQHESIHSTTSMQTKGLKRFISEASFTPVAAEQCLTASLLKRKRRKKNANIKVEDSSSSEDTDDISTDTEIYDLEENSQVAPKATLSPVSTVSVVPPPAVKVEPTPNVPVESATKTPIKCRPDVPAEPALNVPVARLPEIEEQRSKLPIIGEEQVIVECIRYNDVVIISGETGSGKTTQIPQFLYEAGYALNNIIGVTEPRRVAAVSMSERVAQELNLTANEVSYQIRFSGSVTSETKIKFMTDGVLLRECQQDFLLTKYSVIIIDEAHERSVFSDILIGLLSRIVPMRRSRNNPLKLIIMSATLRVDDFRSNTFLFKDPPPIINIETRQYPVTMQFLKTTPSDYLLAAYKKVLSVHSKMPKGGILVFVTSQMDVRALCSKLKKKSGLFCLGLYAMLPIEKQKLVFKAPPEGSRLCVIATNVAETSITIPNIRYVIDTGLEKTKVYDLVTSISKFVTTWTSKSSAEQRMGRAGRMGPGHCYRLYSSAVFTNDFPDHSEPRILQKPVEDVLLQMKSMNIDNVVNFPFPTRPPIESLMAAEKKLIVLGALEENKSMNSKLNGSNKTEFASRLTPLGKEMAQFAVSARCSKMIVISPHDLLPHVISLVSAMTVREMFLEGSEYYNLRKKWAGHGSSKLLGDYMAMLRAVSVADSFGCSSKRCLENGLRSKAMLEIDKLRKQLTTEVNSNQNFPTINCDQILKKPSEAQTKILRQLLLASYSDHVAKKIPDGTVEEIGHDDQGKVIKKKLRHAYESMETKKPVYIGSESVLKGKHPDYVIYKELYQGGKKMYMRDIAVIEPRWLPQ